MNIYMVRRGIEAKFGILYSVDEVIQLLIETGNLTPAKAKHVKSPSYTSLYPKETEDLRNGENSNLPLDKIYRD